MLDVLEASIRRRLPDVICEDVIALQREHNCAMWFAEAVQFQEFLRTEIMKRAALQGVALSALPVNPIIDKTLRIERLQPPIAAGLIRFHASQKALLDQFEQWPDGEHDDGPDCLEMLWTGSLTFAAQAPAGSLYGSGSRLPRENFRGYRL